jgi:hypothetical protein
VARSCEHGDEPSSYVNVRTFLDQISDYHRLTKGPALWRQLFTIFRITSSADVCMNRNERERDAVVQRPACTEKVFVHP